MDCRHDADGFGWGVTPYAPEVAERRAGPVACHPLPDCTKREPVGRASPRSFSQKGPQVFPIYGKGAIPSVLEQVGKLRRLPILIWQGEHDANTPVEGARERAAKLKAESHPVELKGYQGLGHALSAVPGRVQDLSIGEVADGPRADLLRLVGADRQAALMGRALRSGQRTARPLRRDETPRSHRALLGVIVDGPAQD